MTEEIIENTELELTAKSFVLRAVKVSAKSFLPVLGIFFITFSIFALFLYLFSTFFTSSAILIIKIFTAIFMFPVLVMAPMVTAECIYTDFDFTLTDIISRVIAKIPVFLAVSFMMSVPVTLAFTLLRLAGVNNIFITALLMLGNIVFLVIFCFFTVPAAALRAKGVFNSFDYSFYIIRNEKLMFIKGLGILFLISIVSSVIFGLSYGLLVTLAFFATGSVTAIIILLLILCVVCAIQACLLLVPYTTLFLMLNEAPKKNLAYQENKDDDIEDYTDINLTTQKIRVEDIERAIMGQPPLDRGELLKKSQQMNEGERKAISDVFFKEVDVLSGTPEDEMPTLVFDLDSAEGSEMERLMNKVIEKAPEEEDLLSQTIAPSKDALNVEMEVFKGFEDPNPEPPPPPKPSAPKPPPPPPPFKK
ncbi:hypothetical protein Dip518_000023 [Parelusimicrobium proximum]|uniref:hypothetical protein n=1 Tax=Parelusimicrobium proximum TaxID=3228953 RepID=UPI003D16D49F